MRKPPRMKLVCYVIRTTHSVSMIVPAFEREIDGAGISSRAIELLSFGLIVGDQLFTRHLQEDFFQCRHVAIVGHPLFQIRGRYPAPRCCHCG